MKVKIKLWINENIVCMQILEQELDEYVFKTSEVFIEDSASLCGNIITLRGKKKKYNNWISQRAYEDNKEAQEYLEKVISWLDAEFAKNTNPKEGDWVEVKKCDEDEWSKRIFLMKDKFDRILCVHSSDEKYYDEYHRFYEACSWNVMKPIKKSLYNPETCIWEWEG